MGGGAVRDSEVGEDGRVFGRATGHGPSQSSFQLLSFATQAFRQMTTSSKQTQTGISPLLPGLLLPMVCWPQGSHSRAKR